MKKMTYILIVFISVLSCNTEVPTQFSEEALNDSFITLEGDSIPFKEILEKYKGESIVIDVWATWCKDCIVGMPILKALQSENPNAKYVFLSLDKTKRNWKNGIEKYQVKGEHYFMQSGWDGPFGEFIDLDWVPRYMVVDPNGTIKLFRAVKADDRKIKESLN